MIHDPLLLDLLLKISSQLVIVILSLEGLSLEVVSLLLIFPLHVDFAHLNKSLVLLCLSIGVVSELALLVLAGNSLLAGDTSLQSLHMIVLVLHER